MNQVEGGSGGGRAPNSMNNQTPPGSSGGNGRSHSETVRYLNDGSESAEDDTLEVF